MITIKTPLLIEKEAEARDTFECLDSIFDQSLSLEKEGNKWRIDTPLTSKILRASTPLHFESEGDCTLYFNQIKSLTDQQICYREYAPGKWYIITLLEYKDLKKTNNYGK